MAKVSWRDQMQVHHQYHGAMTASSWALVTQCQRCKSTVYGTVSFFRPLCSDVVNVVITDRNICFHRHYYTVQSALAFGIIEVWCIPCPCDLKEYGTFQVVFAQPPSTLSRDRDRGNH